MVDKQEIEKLLSQLNLWDENTQLIKYPQSMLNLINNRFSPMQTIKLGQPDYIIDGNISSGPKPIDHFIDIDSHKIYLYQTVKELKDYLMSL